MEENRPSGFQVTDKRAAAQKESGSESRPEPVESSIPPGADQKQALEEVTFVSFLMSLYSSAMIALGIIPDPVSGKVEPQEEAAKHTVDLLGILREKTRGNLNQEEDQLLEQILYELRMVYLEKTRQIKL